MVTGTYNPHTFKVRRDGIGKQTRMTTNKNDRDFNQGQKLKKKKKERKEKQERMKTEKKKSSNT